MKTVKVVQWSTVWLPLTQTWLYNQLKHLETDIVSSVCCERRDNVDRFPFDRVRVANEGRLIAPSLHRLLRFLGRPSVTSVMREIQRSEGVDVLHSHFGNVGWQNAASSRRQSIPHIVSFYGLDVGLPVRKTVWRRRYEDMFSQVQRVLCEGEYMGASLCRLGCPPDKIDVHRLGIEVDTIRHFPREWSPLQPLKILIAGSFREKKGIPYAIEAIARVSRDIQCEVTVIGDAGTDPSEQDEKKRILSAAAHPALAGRVDFKGYRTHRELLQIALEHHVFMQSSVVANDGDCEGGLPVSLIEMLASGMIVIGTRHCDIPALVRHRDTGWLAEERDILSLVSGVEWAASSVRDWPEITRRGRDLVEAEFNAERQGRRLSAIYRSVC